MPLVNLQHVLKKAEEERYAVGSFDVCNTEMLKGVIAAAEETSSPVRGSLGSRLDAQEAVDKDGEYIYTDVGEAELFVRETGVDALAVAIGFNEKLCSNIVEAVKNETMKKIRLFGSNGKAQ